MKKRILVFLFMFSAVLLVAGQIAEAQNGGNVTVGIQRQITPKHSNGATVTSSNPLVTGEDYFVDISLASGSFDNSFNPPVRVATKLNGLIYEWDACPITTCASKSEISVFTGCDPQDIPSGGSVECRAYDNATDNTVALDGRAEPDVSIIASNAILPADGSFVFIARIYKTATLCVKEAVTPTVRLLTQNDCAEGCPIGVPNGSPDCRTGEEGGGSGIYFPCIPDLYVHKRCYEELVNPNQSIFAEATLVNTGELILTIQSIGNNADNGLDANITSCTVGAVTKTVPFDLLIGEEAICTVSEGVCGTDIPVNTLVCDTVTVTAVPENGGNTLTRTANTPADAPCCYCTGEPACVRIDKNCTNPADCTGQIPYTLSITNASDEPGCGDFDITCEVQEIAQALIDGNPPVDVTIDWTPSLTSPITIEPGVTKSFDGIYSNTPAPSTSIEVRNTVTLVNCKDEFNRPVTQFNFSDSAVCSATCQNEICRTPGFWGTHAGTEKKNSQNITQQVINAGGGSLTVCGQSIDNTNLGCGDSAVEAICVSIKGEQKLQLARQLTAAALNCIMTNGTADCSGVSIDQLFADCNAVCQGTDVPGWDMGKCTDAIDCFNNGGVYNPDLMKMCQTGKCSDNGAPCNENDLSQCGADASINPFWAYITGVEIPTCIPLEGNCHDRELCNEDLGLCFDNPGPAGSSKACNAAIGNSCTVISGCPDC
jgi:hypothetical protein